MVVVNCPYPGCKFRTNNINDALASMLLQIQASGSHSGVTHGHPRGASNISGAARVKKVLYTTISPGGTSEEWP